MKRFLIFLVSSILFTSAGWAQVDTRSIREDAFLVQKEIQIWRNAFAPSSESAVYTCQAVQLDEQWFLTSAHCVYTSCGNSSSCTVQITLAEADLRKQVRIRHTTSEPRVFIYPGFFPGQNRLSSVDVALIRLVPKDASYSYAVLEEGQWVRVSDLVFNERLKFSPETRAQLAVREVRLISSANLPNSLFLPTLIVPKMMDGSLSYLISDSPEVYYVSSLQHFIAPDFGVWRGNSGGGVFTKDGDLAGLVSSLFFTRDGSASFQDDEGNTVLTLPRARDYFLFTGFNGSTLNFIRNRIAYVRTVGALNGFATPTEKEFKDIVQSIQHTFMQF